MWKGDVFAVVGKGLFEIDLIRRTSKEAAMMFYEREIKDVIQFASCLKKLGYEVNIVCVAHFPYKGWFRMSLSELGYAGGDIQINNQGEWIME